MQFPKNVSLNLSFQCGIGIREILQLPNTFDVWKEVKLQIESCLYVERDLGKK
jgi:hypothetical protein